MITVDYICNYSINIYIYLHPIVEAVVVIFEAVIQQRHKCVNVNATAVVSILTWRN